MATITNAPELMDEIQAAAYLGGANTPLSKQTLRNWRVRGHGPRFLKLGRLIRYNRSDLDEYLSSTCRRSTSDRGRVAA